MRDRQLVVTGHKFNGFDCRTGLSVSALWSPLCVLLWLCRSVSVRVCLGLSGSASVAGVPLDPFSSNTMVSIVSKGLWFIHADV